MKLYLSFDIGGTDIKYGIIDESGHIISKDIFEARATEIGGIGIIENIIKIINEIKKSYDISGIGISSHGMIDPDKGIILHADNHLIPKYTGLNVKEIIVKSCNLPCEIENDVNCAGLGELWLDKFNNKKYISFVTVGTGIGSCLLQDGKLIHGSTMCAGEIGKTLIQDDRLEELASTRVLVEKLEKRLGLRAKSLNGKKIFEKVDQGDEIYIEELNLMIHNLAIGLANLCLTFNPSVIILGGGIMARDDYFLPRLYKEMKILLPDIIFENTTLKTAKLKNDAGMIGAVKNFIDKNKIPV